MTSFFLLIKLNAASFAILAYNDDIGGLKQILWPEWLSLIVKSRLLRLFQLFLQRVYLLSLIVDLMLSICQLFLQSLLLLVFQLDHCLIFIYFHL